MAAAVSSFDDVEFGDELPELQPDVSFDKVIAFCRSAYGGIGPSRFTDSEAAKKEGLPGAIVPRIMSQGIMVAMIHAWATGCTIRKIDTVFRATLLVGSTPTCRAVVTDLDDETRTLSLDLTIVNEAGETRVLGTATVEI